MLAKRMRPIVLAASLAMICGIASAYPEHRGRDGDAARNGPPPPRAEVQLPRPGPSHHWAPGHWRWDGRAHNWEAGRWIAPRPHERFVAAFWAQEYGRWVYHPEQWIPLVEPVAYIDVVPFAPPPLRVEYIPVAPSPNHFWIAGYWQWMGGRHQWVAGHWERRRHGHQWIEARWQPAGHGWRFSGGHWR